MPAKSKKTDQKKKLVEKANAAKSLEKKPKAKMTLRSSVLQAMAPEDKPKKVKAVKASATEALSKLEQKWAGFYKKAGETKAAPYSMKNRYEPKTAIMHKVLGWGYILESKNDRLEVLFKDGIKFLISNYKA